MCLFKSWSFNPNYKKSFNDVFRVQRRMTKIFSLRNNTFYDDYAHHPTEISSVLEGIKKFQKIKITSVFQPHRYSRVQSLKIDFSKSFNNLIALFYVQFMLQEKKKLGILIWKILRD